MLIYEMIVGVPPFYNKNQHKMYKLIIKTELKFPEKSKHGFELSPEATDLLKKLLEKDQQKRLGKVGGVQEILSHPWFASVDQEKMLRKEIKAPFIPVILPNQKIVKQSARKLLNVKAMCFGIEYLSLPL